MVRVGLKDSRLRNILNPRNFVNDVRQLHRCRRYWEEGVECPFKGRIEHLDEPPDEEFTPVGERNRRTASSAGIVNEFEAASVDEVFQQRMRNAVQQQPVAAISTKEGELQRIIGKARSGLHIKGDEYQILLALLGGLGMAEGLRRMRGSGQTPISRAVRVSEQRLASGLKKVSVRGLARTIPSQSFRGSGRGFFQDAAAQLSGDLNLGLNRRKIVIGGAGFFFPGEPT